ncbi:MULTISPECIES: STAS domain-containing protein [unclassified Streptomyces]|uniref:STAS domain-containing protein n=1 Tax=unclassified Streptomyces TaxID=2593676 RepID=UPI002E0EFC30|nr:STAS domain-containing protein [Streptomyces sp. NBC_01207]WTA17018.1 STAS domain-containing protein [Streptomyces sp. NBC_00853]
MRSDFEIHIRRSGATLHVTPVGELDVDCDQALKNVRMALAQGVAVAACDMRRLTFLDLAGLHYLLGLARDAHSRGVAFFAYNWQHQPQQILDRTDHLARTDGRDPRTGPTRLLRQTLHEAAESTRAADTARASTAGQPAGDDWPLRRCRIRRRYEDGAARWYCPQTSGHRA